MTNIPPALFVVPPYLQGPLKDIFASIATPVEISSRLLSHPHLAEFGESDLAPYWQGLLKSMAPLSRIVDRAQPVPHSIWESAYRTSQAVRPVYELLESFFTEGNMPSARYEKQRHLKLTLNRLVALKGTFAEESLILGLQRALAVEKDEEPRSAAVAGTGMSANLRGRADGKTDTLKKIPKNSDALRLMHLLGLPRNKSRSKIEIAREFCEENHVVSAKPESLLRKIRDSGIGAK